MVYKKYIKRGGKTYGPYLYHSVKKDGKVTTNYLGRQEGSSENKNKGKNFLKSNKFLIMFLSIVAVALLLNLALDINLFPTGKVSSDIQGVYVEGQNLKGQVNLILKQGELFPADSQVIIDNAGKIEPYLLSSMIFNEKVTGNFYIEGKNLSGSGDGYGIPGQKEVFPNVLFSFRLVPSVSLDNVSEGNISGGVGGVGDVGEDGTSVKPIVNDTPSEPRVNESVSSNETTVEPEQPPANETPIEEPEQTQESPVTEPAEEIPPENPAEEQVPSEESSSVKESVSEPEPSAEEPASEPSSITGEVVGQEIIEGIVSKNSPYEYILPEGVDVEVVNSFQLVNFDIIDNKAIFTTDYSEFEEGFGQEFTGEDILTIPISLNNLSIKAKQGTLKISFNYLESELTSSSKEITVTAQNITNQTIMNVTNLTKQEKINKLLEKKIKFEKKALDELLVKDKIRVIIKTKPGAISVGEKLEGLEDYEFVELDEFNLELLDENEIDEIVIDQPVSALISESESIIRSLDVRNEFGLSGLGKKICIIDTGVDGSVTPYTLGWDFVNNDSDASDDNGHGTQVAYIAKSVAPGAELLVAKVLDSNGLGYESQVLEGLQWCVDNGANIISFSIGSGDYNGFCDVNVVAGLANIAVDNGIFVAAATGNDGTSNLKSPACASSVTRVSASDKQDAIASFSNVNEALDVFAPGKDISTQTIGGSVTSISGTSASVLFVSGAAALVLENETIAPLDLRYRFASTGKPILHSLGENLTINISRLDVYNAIINNVTMVPYNVTLNQANETNVTNFTGLATTYTLGPNLGVYDTTGGGCLLLGQLNVNEIGTFFQSTFSYSACFGTGSCIGGGTFDWCSGIICKSGFFSDSNCYENFDLAFASGYFSSSTDVVNAVVGSNGVYDVYICGRASSGLQNPSANPCCYGVATSYACNENIGGTVGCWDGQANCDSDSTCHIGVGSCRANSATLNVYTCDNTDLDAYQTQCVTPCGNIWTGNGGQNNCCGDDLSEPANPQATETSCWDGTDNDCDGFTDSADTNCQCTTGSAPGCSGGVCVNGICRASCEGYSGYACSAGAGLLSSGTCADDFGCLTTPFVNMDCSATGTTACEKGTDYSYYTCDYYSNDSCDSSIGGDFVQNGISALVGVDCGCGTSCVYDAGSFLANCSFNPTNGPQCDDGNQGSFLNHGDFNAGTQRYDSNDTICDECNNGFLGEDSTCEKVCGASASCDEKLPNADTGACTYGVSQREDFCSSICGASDGTCESACGASTQCDEKNPGYDLTYCGNDPFADECSSICGTVNIGDNICRSSAFNSSCTANANCNSNPTLTCPSPSGSFICTSSCGYVDRDTDSTYCTDNSGCTPYNWISGDLGSTYPCCGDDGNLDDWDRNNTAAVSGACYNGALQSSGYILGRGLVYDGYIYECGGDAGDDGGAAQFINDCGQAGTYYCDADASTSPGNYWINNLRPNDCAGCTLGTNCVSGICIDNVGTGYCRASCTGYTSSVNKCSDDGTNIFTNDGICTKTTTTGLGDCDETAAVYNTLDYLYQCSDSAVGYGNTCDPNSLAGGYVVGGICGDNGGATCLTGAACKDSESGNGIKSVCTCAATAADWDPYDSSVSNGVFSANGICIGTTPDTIGEACLDGTTYRDDCTSCGKTAITDNDACDSSIIDGAYASNGMCVEAGADDACDIDGGVCSITGTTGTLYGSCASCGQTTSNNDACMSGPGISYAPNGMCVSGGACDTDQVCDNEGTILNGCLGGCSVTSADVDRCDSNGGTSFGGNGYCTAGGICATGPVYEDVVGTLRSGCAYDSGNNRCDLIAEGTEDGSWSSYAEGVCVSGNTCDIGDVCLNSGVYYGAMSSCVNTNQCDSDIVSGYYTRDGYVCSSQCVVDGSVAGGGTCCQSANCAVGFANCVDGGAVDGVTYNICCDQATDCAGPGGCYDNTNIYPGTLNSYYCNAGSWVNKTQYNTCTPIETPTNDFVDLVINQPSVSCGGVTINVNSLTIKPTGELTLDGTILITKNTTVENEGSLFIKNSKNTIWQNGNLTISGNYVLQNSTLRMNGTSPNGAIGINVTSTGNMKINESSNITNGQDSAYRYAFIVNSGANFSLVDSSLSYFGWDNNVPGRRGLEINETVKNFSKNNISNFLSIVIYSNNNYISSNNIQLSGFDAFQILDSTNNTLVNNIVNNSIGGFSLSNANSSNISYNNLSQFLFGSIRLSSSFYNNISNNLAYNAASSHLSLTSFSSYNYIKDNIFNYTRLLSESVVYLASSSINNTFLNNYLGYSSYDGVGIYTGSGNNTFVNTTLFNNSKSVFVSSSDGNVFIDSRINSSRKADIHLETGTFTTTLISTIFNKSNVSIIGSGINLKVKWYLDVNVTNQTGEALNGANVTAWNVSYPGVVSTFSTLTDTSGFITRQNVTEYLQTSSGKYFETNYTLNVSALGFLNASLKVNLTKSTQLDISLVDLCSPPNGDWNLSWSCVIQNRIIILAQNKKLNILSGGSLTLRNVTLLLNSTADGNSGIRVWSGGSMNITDNDGAGSLINSTNANNEYFFIVDSGSNFSMMNSRLEESGFGSGLGQKFEIYTTMANFSGNFLQNNYVTSIYSENNLVYNNTIVKNKPFSGTTFGLQLEGSNNKVIGNNISDITGDGIYVSSTNNLIQDNFISYNLKSGISIFSNDHNLLNNNIIFNNSQNGIYLVDVTNTSIMNTNISNNSIGVEVDLSVSGGINKIIDSVFANNKNELVLGVIGSSSSKLVLLNSTFNKSRIVFSESSLDQLIVQWYFDVNVKNGTGTNFEGANVSAWNVSGSLNFTELTNSTGSISRKNLTEYIQYFDQDLFEVVKVPGTNYTVNVTGLEQLNYRPYSKQLNLTNSTLLNVVLVSNIFPSIPSVLLNSTSGYNVTKDNLTAYYSSSDTEGDPITNITDWRVNGSSILVLNMPFNTRNDNASKTVRDYSMYGNNGTLGSGVSNSMPNWTSNGKIGGAYVFDGVNDNISILKSSSLNNLNGITFEAWIKPRVQSGVGYVFSNFPGGSVTGGSLLVYYSSSKITVYLDGSANSITSAASLSAGQWYHVVLSANSTIMNLYINGQFNGTNTLFFDIFLDNTQNFSIGSTLSGINFFNGTIDEVRVYNRSLSPQQIYQNYIDGLANRSMDVITDNETKYGDIWSVAVTPNDAYGDWVSVMSNPLTVLNYLPNVTLISPSANNTSNNRYPVFVWDGFDADSDGDIIDYTLNITLYSTGAGASCSDPQRIISVTQETYTLTEPLRCLSDDNYYYNWTVRGRDQFGYGSWAPVRMLNVSSLISINLTNKFINFSSMIKNEENDTTDDNPLPFVIENDGNDFVNVTVNATNLWNTVLNPSTYYQYSVNNTPELYSFNWTLSKTSWTFVPDILTLERAVVHLNWSNETDSAEVDIYVKAPIDEGAGTKSSLITFTASRSGAI